MNANVYRPVRTRIPALSGLLICASLIGLIVAPPANSISRTLTTTNIYEYGGNYIDHWITFDLQPGMCVSGATGYKLISSSFMFVRSDSQFTASFKQGLMSNSGSFKCTSGSGVLTSKTVNITMSPTSLHYGTKYTKSFGSSDYVIQPDGDNIDQLGGYVAATLYRGGAKKAVICSYTYATTPTGDPCRSVVGN